MDGISDFADDTMAKYFSDGNINIRNDPSVIDGPQRIGAVTRSNKKSARDFNSISQEYRGGNNLGQIQAKRYTQGSATQQQCGHHQNQIPQNRASSAPPKCNHVPKCRFFLTFGYWCCLTDEERYIINSIRQ